jgi:hypothetical protein
MTSITNLGWDVATLKLIGRGAHGLGCEAFEFGIDRRARLVVA